jgi:ABC-type lipoprotein release transport system permease subunit
MFTRFNVIALMAWRNLTSRWIKNLIVGFIMFFGTFLLVLGTALLDSVDHSMTQSITASLAGHLQVYSKDAKDELALFGGGFMGADDLDKIRDFLKVKEELKKNSNVEAVVPMGIDIAALFTGNQIDEVVTLMKADAEIEADILANKDRITKKQKILEKASSDEFWKSFDEDPLPALEFLYSSLASIGETEQMTFLRYVGTDIDMFSKYFDRFEIVEGQMVPKGQRGFLLNKGVYELRLKNRVAREFDKIHRLVIEDQRKIGQDKILQTMIAQNSRQYRRITFYLSPEQADELKPKLIDLMFVEDKNKSLDELVQQFLLVDDPNIEQRYKFFYDEIAPKIKLYMYQPGDVLTIRAFTRSGYMKAVNVKIYGVFRFKGMDTSLIAGQNSLMDMMTFRDLYSLMTEEKKAEIEDIRKDVGVVDVEQDSVEDALFGSDQALEEAVDESEGFDEFAGVDLTESSRLIKELENRVYSQYDIDKGVALNAAIILKDPSRLEATKAELERMIADKKLGLQVVDWKNASGIVGQIVIIVRIVLYVAISIIFLVALVIINNSMTMAALRRTREIGTMRAIGAQARFVLVLFLAEILLLGLVSGMLGGLTGAWVVSILGDVGISAGTTDLLIFLFSGPRLYPAMTASNFTFGFVVIVFVSLISTLYPAFLANRIQPFVAMQERE